MLTDVCKILEIPDKDFPINGVNEEYFETVFDGTDSLMVIDQIGLYELISFNMHHKFKNLDEENKAAEELFTSICLPNSSKFERMLFLPLFKKVKNNALIIRKQKEILQQYEHEIKI